MIVKSKMLGEGLQQCVCMCETLFCSTVPNRNNIKKGKSFLGFRVPVNPGGGRGGDDLSPWRTEDLYLNVGVAVTMATRGSVVK